MPDAVLMPVYNEAPTVATVLDAVRRYFRGEIIVVDDGSTDETPRVLAARSDITTVHLDRNCGYGCALKVGFGLAADMGVSHLITMDCDGQHEPAHIPQFLDALASGGDIISGSRYLPGSASVGVAPNDRRSINATVTSEINRVTGWGLTDAFCGFKAYRLHAIECIRLRESGYAMPLELWAKAWRCGLSVREISVERIYCGQDRSFGELLDDPERRLAYYMAVWSQALEEDER
ncbi:MAG: glycosyltransferase family 2 protein [Coriobacteriia bacterium]|nr:glycosyltransferase family 2 protein [Coriobacteriia bacterium]